jgi:hypothetical protein
MGTEMLSKNLRDTRISAVIPVLQSYLQSETGQVFPREIIGSAVQEWLDQRVEALLDDMPEVLTSPHRPEANLFAEILDKQLHMSVPANLTRAEAEAETQSEESVFSGHVPFSPAKLSAMVQYITQSGRRIYRTNLNKLLFYSDLTNYYLHHRGISGATYVNMPYGPVPEGIDNVLETAIEEGTVRKASVEGPGIRAQALEPGERPSAAEGLLTNEEIETLEWVLDRYGHLSSVEISDLSHTEKAYANTRRGEPIAYAYAKFLKNLPPRRSHS